MPTVPDAHNHKHGPWLEVHESRCGDGRVRMILDGELDLASGGALRARLGALERAHEAVILDLSKLSFIDCAGLQVLVDALEVAASDGNRLQIAGDLPLSVRRLVELIDAAGLSNPAIAALAGGTEAAQAEPGVVQ
jgi:anti-anti-sigma factor